MSTFIFIRHYFLSDFFSLAVMSFHKGTQLWLQSCKVLPASGFCQMWAVMFSRLELGICFLFLFFSLDTNTGLLYVIVPPVILNHHIVVLYIFDKNDLMYWDYYCLKILVNWEGYGAKFILDTNKKKIYVNSYKSIDINTDPWGTLLDCSSKFVHLFDSVYQFPFIW